jgi:hypothetical protein
MRYASFLAAGTAALLATVPRPVTGQQTFQGVVGLTTPNGPIEASVKNGKARFTTQTPMGPAGIIMDPASSEINIIIDAQKMIMVMKINRSDSTSGTDSTVVTPLAKRDTIAGHECRVFRFVSAKSATDICIASGLGNLGAAGLFGGGSVGMGRGRTSAPAWTAALASQGGFPLRVADTTGAVQYQVTKIESKTLPDSIFVPPADYQKMNMPSFGRPPGND